MTSSTDSTGDTNPINLSSTQDKVLSLAIEAVAEGKYPPGVYDLTESLDLPIGVLTNAAARLRDLGLVEDWQSYPQGVPRWNPTEAGLKYYRAARGIE